MCLPVRRVPMAGRIARFGHGTGRAYQNFPDQKLADPLRSYYGQNLPRLRDVKRHYDPDNFFCHQQSIPLGTDKTDS